MPAKTVKAKMLAGEVYNCLDPELVAARQHAKMLFRSLNSVAKDEERRTILETLLGHIGHNSIIEPPFYCSYGGHIFIGDNVYLNFNCTILDNNEVHIGHEVMIGPSVQIYTAAHPLDAVTRTKRLETADKVIIEDNVRIGGRAIILPDVVIGLNAVVGAGAVVTKNVPPDSVVVGNPARIMEVLEE